MEMFGGLVRSFSKTTDEYYLSATVKDVNDFFDQEMTFLHQYHQNLKEATNRADRQTSKHKDVADSYIKISTSLLQLATTDTGKLERFLTKIAETFEKLRVNISFKSYAHEFEGQAILTQNVCRKLKAGLLRTRTSSCLTHFAITCETLPQPSGCSSVD